MIPVQLLGEQTSASIEPVDDGIGVLGHRSREDDEGVPRSDLGIISAKSPPNQRPFHLL